MHRPSSSSSSGGSRVNTLLVIFSNVICMLFLFVTTSSSPPAASDPAALRSVTSVNTQLLNRLDQLSNAVVSLQTELSQVKTLTTQAASAAVAVPAAVPPPTAGGPTAAVPAAVPATAVAPATASSSSSTPARTVVMGLAKDIDYQNLHSFVRSLREASSSVDIVIFTDNVPPDQQELYSTFRVTLAKYSLSQFTSTVAGFHPSSYRWMLQRDYLNELESQGKTYDAVMFTDVRDTVFQADPFQHLKDKGFYVFLEAKPGIIRQCGWNSGWVKDCFGSRVLQQVGGNVISCSGTSMANGWEYAKAYATKMASYIEGNTKCERNGVDQGVHNVMVWRSEMDDLHIISNEDGWIATVQAMKSITRDRFGHVLNKKNEPVAVVHQYDRSPELSKQFNSQYFTLADNQLRKK